MHKQRSDPSLNGSLRLIYALAPTATRSDARKTKDDPDDNGDASVVAHSRSHLVLALLA